MTWEKERREGTDTARGGRRWEGAEGRNENGNRKKMKEGKDI